ncbi:MAG: hypothetical protein ACFWTY_14600 [Shouchella clausii]|jgi:toxin YxiD
MEIYGCELILLTKYDHVYIFDESGNPLDVNLNVVDRKSPDAHINIKSEVG